MSAVLELLLADARTPSGGYAHSGGLESAVGGGLTGPEVVGFMRARPRTVGRCEATVAAVASGCDSLGALLALDHELAARTPVPPLRRASRQLGRGLLRTATEWFPKAVLLAEYRRTSELSPRPVALGVIARCGGLSAIATARSSLYDDAATVSSAAVKLLALDAARASSWLVMLKDEIERLAASCATPSVDFPGSWPVTRFAALPSTATPLLDQHAMTLSTSQRRLFVS